MGNSCYEKGVTHKLEPEDQLPIRMCLSPLLQACGYVSKQGHPNSSGCSVLFVFSFFETSLAHPLGFPILMGAKGGQWVTYAQSFQAFSYYTLEVCSLAPWKYALWGINLCYHISRYTLNGLFGVISRGWNPRE